MIENTFVHIPGIGLTTEKQLWDDGILCWDDCFKKEINLGPTTTQNLEEGIEHSKKLLNKDKLYEILNSLDTKYHWRTFEDYRDQTAYFDIETTGLDPGWAHITTIAVYDGKKIFTYVNGKNLKDFKRDIKKYKTVVTFNGKLFDSKFIDYHLGINLDKLKIIHLDLMWILKSIGLSGGLKNIERTLDINRGKLEGITGYDAVRLWHIYEKNKKQNKGALDTLLAYNVEDVVNLEKLMIYAWNEKIKSTPFKKRIFSKAKKVKNPYKPDMKYIKLLRAFHR